MASRNSGTSADEVVVGTDGSPEADSALEWAAAEANRRAVSLRIVHATGLRARVGSKPLPAASQNLVTGIARTLLDDARDRVTGKYPELDVVVTLVHDQPAEAMVSASQDAALAVTGTRGHGGFAGLLVGSTSLRTAAHTSCPFVVVRGHEAARTHGTVLVGVQDLADSAALAFAVATAQRWDASVRALHAWGPLNEMGRVAPQIDTIEAIRQEHAQILATAMETVAVPPGVRVTRELVDSRTAAALVEASADAELLVVGAHRPSVPVGLRLGMVVHAVLHHAHCPVAVVPE